MANDISGFGLVINLRASSTFPQGITLTQFADDSDPFDIPSLQIADKSIGLNGDMLTWSTANAIETSISVVPDSDDDRNLSVLFEANRPGRGKRPARDVITLTGIYPDGRQVTLTSGAIMTGMPSSSVASAGRKKTKTYGFAFENKA